MGDIVLATYNPVKVVVIAVNYDAVVAGVIALWMFCSAKRLFFALYWRVSLLSVHTTLSSGSL